MPDITMCKDKACPDRGDCYRYVANPNQYRQSYFSTTPRPDKEVTCAYFLDASYSSNLVSLYLADRSNKLKTSMRKCK